MSFLPDNKVEPRIVRDWDSMPPVVEAYGEVFSTRVLTIYYRRMKEALESIRDQGLDASQCQQLADNILKGIKG
jgi:hypothetical protein